VDIFFQLALFGAVACGLGAAYMLWAGQNAAAMGRRARFDTERQMATVRQRRTTTTALGLGGLAVVLLLINLIGGAAVKAIEPTPTATHSIPPTSTLEPAARQTLVATLLPTPTATPPLPTAVVTGADDPGLRLRESPNGAQIDYLKSGTVVELLPDAQVTTADGITWQKIRDPQQREGWVAVAYLVKQ
jgi:Bacterial SH3 domain